MRTATLLILLGLTATFAQEAGIRVRFLANPSSDAIVKYGIYRSTTPDDFGTKIGEVQPGTGDTLHFDDLKVTRGTVYLYSITAFTEAGLESGYSTQTRIALPVLDLPATLTADKSTGGVLRVSLPQAAHPLKGFEPLTLEILGDSPFNATFDGSAGTALLTAKSGQPDSAQVRIRVSYFGIFGAEDEVRVILRSALSLQGGARHGSVILAEPTGPGLLGLRFQNLPDRGSVTLLGLAGGRIETRDLQGMRDGMLYLDSRRYPAGPCLYRVLDPQGRLQGSGRVFLGR